jgi:hypothetical protein
MSEGVGTVSVVADAIVSKIYLIRGQKVMIDRDLAELNDKEFQEWRSQIGTSNEGDKMGLRYAPYAFTEQGVAMLSSVLSSERAIKVNIQIMRIYTRMRELIMTNQEILLKLEQLERKVDGHDEKIQVIFAYLKKLLNPPVEPRPRIGFRRKDERE